MHFSSSITHIPNLVTRTTASNMQNFQKKKDTIVHMPMAFLHPFVAN